jgi:tryptophan synthase beta chain
MTILNSTDGYFGEFGGTYTAETLRPLLQQVAKTYAELDENFWQDFAYYSNHYTGRPSPIYEAKRLSENYGNARILFKRDELNHTGSHKINNCIGQILLAQKMGKKRIIAETGAGQHGVATATVCALFDIPCTIYMGAKDKIRQKPNVFRMHLLGAEVIGVEQGNATLKDAMNEALRDWVTNVEDTYYLIGTAAGPHPYPQMVANFQSIIGKEARKQVLEYAGKLPDAVVACIGGGSNSIGLFNEFLRDEAVKLYGVEAAGKGLETGQTAASITNGQVGILHGNKTYLLQDDNGQIRDAYSISAGLDYPGIGPQHAYLHNSGRVEYVSVSDDEALAGFQDCCKFEGIIPALEPSHAIAYLKKLSPKMSTQQIILMNLCGRGDKDIFNVAQALGYDIQ